MRRTSNWLIKNVIIAFLRAFIGITDRTTCDKFDRRMAYGKFTLIGKVSRAVDNAAARLGYDSIKQKQRAAIEVFYYLLQRERMSLSRSLLATGSPSAIFFCRVTLAQAWSRSINWREQLLKLSRTLIGNMDGQKFEKHNPSTVGYLTVQNSPLSMVTNDVAAQSALMLLPHSRLAS